jgi:hypothetical protein
VKQFEEEELPREALEEVADADVGDHDELRSRPDCA